MRMRMQAIVESRVASATLLRERAAYHRSLFPASRHEETTMHAWLCENPIGVEALSWKELPTPEPKTGEVRVAIRAASLNFPDLLIVQNKYQMKPPLPFVPGSEYSGVVDALGAGVTHIKPGDNVACLSGTGGVGPPNNPPPAPGLPPPPGPAPVHAAP